MSIRSALESSGGSISQSFCPLHLVGIVADANNRRLDDCYIDLLVVDALNVGRKCI